MKKDLHFYEDFVIKGEENFIEVLYVYKI